MEQRLSCEISLAGIMAAQHNVYQHLKPSALIHYPALSSLIGAEIYIKHENHLPGGSFKLRGGINLMAHLKAQPVRGVITFSTGNHGLSVATAAAWAGLPAVVVVPQTAAEAKKQLIRQTGAELIEAGVSFEEAARKVEELCVSRELYYVHPADEPHLINGVGTGFLEVVNELPDLDALIVPVGAGSEAAAAATVLSAVRPQASLYAVQASASPAACRSWQAGQIVSADNSTFAGGFATGTGYQVPFDIYQPALRDFVCLSEDELYQGIALAAYYTHNLVEGAGGATIMAALRLREQLAGKKVVLQMSGCNATPEELRKAAALEVFSQGLAER